MPNMIFIAHLPLLRIDEETCPFGFGKLWRMPFENYDSLTLGAFTDHRPDYEKTAPVFYYIEIEDEWPNLSPGKADALRMAQMKFPSNNWSLLPQLRMGFLPIVLETFVEPAWAALSLAAPAAVLPAPKLSTVFAVPDGDFFFDFPDREPNVGIQIQGDADQEFVFMPEAAAPPLSGPILAKAENVLSLIYGIHPGQKSQPNPKALPPEILAAMDVLLAASAPSLTGPERLTLAVTALESLLLPEVMSGLGSTFSRRLSGLCGADEPHRLALKKIAQKLYAYRSANVHGGGGGLGKPSRTLGQAHAQQILAATIITAGQKAQAGLLPEELSRALDNPTVEFNPNTAGLPLSDPPGMRTAETMLMRRSPVVDSQTLGVDMTSREGHLMSWSPLVGLGINTGKMVSLGQPARAVVDTLSGDELLSMEDRDIVRDFAGEVRMVEHKHAVIGVLVSRNGDAYTLPDGEVYPLLRTGDLAVTALRMAGFKRFFDPELLGWYLYQAKERLRRPTIYRQSVLIDFRVEPQEILTDADVPRVSAFLDLLFAYESQALDGSVEHVLRLYRRGFDRRFLPLAGRAGLMLSCLEAMLGRFRKREDPVQLEALVGVFAQVQAPAAAEWFRLEGRKFRNSVAHGFWEPLPGVEQVPLEHLLDLLTALVPPFVRSWLEQPEHGRRTPESIFTAAARAELDRRKRA
jgi:hypothetical protein